MLVNFVGFFKDPTFFLLVLRDSSFQSLCGHCFLSVLCVAAMSHLTPFVLEKAHLKQMLLDALLNENTEVKLWEAGAPKPDDCSLQRGPPHSAFGLYHLLWRPVFRLLRGRSHGSLFPHITCQWVPHHLVSPLSMFLPPSALVQ